MLVGEYPQTPKIIIEERVEMANREREKQISIRVTEEEYEFIKKKMEIYGTDNLSMYARKMLMDGYIVKTDMTDIKELTKELAYLSRSINQIAKRVNETRSIHREEIEELKKYYGEIKAKVSERLVKFIERDER